MQKPIVATLDEKFLEPSTADSDRFVFGNYVIKFEPINFQLVQQCEYVERRLPNGELQGGIS